MHKGNGLCVEFPIPKGADGDSVLYGIAGRCAILKPGEGYEVRDGNIVFDEPPPIGASIAIGSKAGGFSSKEALDRIVESMEAMRVMFDSAKEHQLEAERRWTNNFYHYKKELEDSVIEARQEMEASHDKRLNEVSEAYGKTLDSQIEELTEKVDEAIKAESKSKELLGIIRNLLSSFEKEWSAAIKDCRSYSKEANDSIEKVKEFLSDARRTLDADITSLKDAVMSDILNYKAEGDKAIADALRKTKNAAARVELRMQDVENRTKSDANRIVSRRGANV